MITPRRRFVLIRHGQTEANRDQVIAGRIEAQLTMQGQAGALALTEWAWPDQIALFSSPQDRAQDTARIGFPRRALTLLDGLHERNWGDLEGRPLAELTPREDTPPGGEAWSSMLTRVATAVTAALAQVQDNPQVLPVLVGHSGVIRAVRQLTGGSAHGPSPRNTTPYLYAPNTTGLGWREIELTKKDDLWTV